MHSSSAGCVPAPVPSSHTVRSRGKHTWPARGAAPGLSPAHSRFVHSGRPRSPRARSHMCTDVRRGAAHGRLRPRGRWAASFARAGLPVVGFSSLSSSLFSGQHFRNRCPKSRVGEKIRYEIINQHIVRRVDAPRMWTRIAIAERALAMDC